MFGGFSRHFRHVSISKNAFFKFLIFNWLPCGRAVLHKVKTLQRMGIYAGVIPLLSSRSPCQSWRQRLCLAWLRMSVVINVVNLFFIMFFQTHISATRSGVGSGLGPPAPRWGVSLRRREAVNVILLFSTFFLLCELRDVGR